MITVNEFLDLVRDTPGLQRDLRHSANVAQLSAIIHSDDRMLMLTAGPGSGKTTVLVLRALRYVLVDGLFPEQLLITTFTKKAAKELRTRWLDWGTALLKQLAGRIDERTIDLNRCRIDTIDSIAQQVLSENRLPGEISPIVAETSASKLILKRSAFGDAYRTPATRSLLDNLFSRYTFDGSLPANQGDALDLTKRLCERIIQDRVNIGLYRAFGPAQEQICQILYSYQLRMKQTHIFDFTSLQETFLDRLEEGLLDNWLTNISLLLIDEYQDTNPLQEAIYFAIIRRASPHVTIVGDDDQSMYRFRGGSVELFTSYASRAHLATGRSTLRVDMVRNFRSTPEIVYFYNQHIATDPVFASARISPSKPAVIPSRPPSNIPVLGMFRPDAQVLADDLAQFLDNLLTHRRTIIGTPPNTQEILISADGALGDAVFLSHSVEEQRYNKARGPQPATVETRFAGMLRSALMARGRNAFNPRGLSLRVIPNVQRLLGLLLICVDADTSAIEEVYPTNEARHFLSIWRQLASNFIKSNPFPRDGKGLQGFVSSWQIAATGAQQKDFPRDWPVLELLFKLLTWLPQFQTDPEHQVWLEAITRIISSASMASAYGMQLLQNADSTTHNDHVRQSRLSFIRDALLPIAENEVDVDEDIMPSVPRDRLQMMTIHQSKGLEFPLVIVDVGSHFNTNHQSHKFRRFPSGESNVTKMEDDVEPFLPSPLRSGRSPMDRTFDDLVRLYYVAYSRPQSLLLLVGNESCLKYGAGKHLTGAIPNIAMGWRRDNSWAWRQSFQSKQPPVMVEPPLIRI